MLFEGGVYADSDTSPVAHPYMWGIEARSVLHPDLEVVERILKSHEAADASHRRVWEKRSPVEKEGKKAEDGKDAAEGDDAAEPKEKKAAKEVKEAKDGAEDCDDKDGKCAPPKKSTLPKGQKHIPVYHGHRRTDARGPPYDQTSLLSPDINVVVSIAWDSESTIKLRRWTQWSFGLLKDSARQSDYGRSLQFERYVIAVSWRALGITDKPGQAVPPDIPRHSDDDHRHGGARGRVGERAARRTLPQRHGRLLGRSTAIPARAVRRDAGQAARDPRPRPRRRRAHPPGGRVPGARVRHRPHDRVHPPVLPHAPRQRIRQVHPRGEPVVLGRGVRDLEDWRKAARLPRPVRAGKCSS